jgi:2-polyprenyl-3-methyl-5-hydroxy-6-metoxy-1,4-benzoquinol methylase
MPQNIYDNPAFFERYSQFGRSREGLAAAPEWPAMKSMLPPVKGLRVLDLGCGFGWFARWACENGAQSILGIDLSEKMLDRACSLTHDQRVTYRRENIESLDLAGESFDLVYSSLVLHYIEDFDAMCAMVWRLLVSGGSFVFSVEHPVFTAALNQGWQTDDTGAKVWPVSHYLLEGERVTNWITPGVVKQHRTIESYVNGLIDNGFQITRLVEWGPTQKQIAKHPDWADELHRPPFLLLAART